MLTLKNDCLLGFKDGGVQFREQSEQKKIFLIPHFLYTWGQWRVQETEHAQFSLLQLWRIYAYLQPMNFN